MLLTVCDHTECDKYMSEDEKQKSFTFMTRLVLDSFL
jgi:purine-nucleoside phosphorylase